MIELNSVSSRYSIFSNPFYVINFITDLFLLNNSNIKNPSILNFFKLLKLSKNTHLHIFLIFLYWNYRTPFRVE